MEISGQHIILDAFLRKDAFHLLGAKSFSWSMLLKALEDEELPIIKTMFHEFSSDEENNYHGGYTALVLLGESHVSIHTWPEEGYFSMDIYTCNPDRKLRGLIDKILTFFSVSKYNLLKIDRGHHTSITNDWNE